MLTAGRARREVTPLESQAEFAGTYADVDAGDPGLPAAATATGRVPVAAG